jgi:ABC-type polysaccharide transport system permease subunit
MTEERRSEAEKRESPLTTFVRKNARYFLILPPLIVVILFLDRPVTHGVVTVISTRALVTKFDPTKITLDNFIAVFSRPSTYIILRDTLGMSGASRISYATSSLSCCVLPVVQDPELPTTRNHNLHARSSILG